jgi:UDP-N-acetyl-D-glucosamine dehydrogenase
VERAQGFDLCHRKKEKMKTNVSKNITFKKIAVVGLGYVGLPLAVEFAKKGVEVAGIERNPERVNAVNSGKSYISDIVGESLERVVKEGRLRAYQDFKYLSDVEAIIICVPTPLTINKAPDVSYIIDTSENITPYLHKGELVVLESTTYPGTTEEVVLPILSKSGLKPGEDFYLAFSPERIDPGNKEYHVSNIPKVVGGINEKSTELAAGLYKIIVPEVYKVSSPKVAEITKLLENTFRLANIALVDELAILCEKMGISIWEVIEAAKTKPYGFMPFYPGPGIGGHCIPIDPFYLQWKAKEYDVDISFIEIAGRINDSMPDYVVQKVAYALNSEHKSINGSKVLVLGVTYKNDISDTRESPSIKIIEKLEKWGAYVSYYDPFVPDLIVNGKTFNSLDGISKDILKDFDAVVILTAHSNVDYDLIYESADIIVDTRNAIKKKRKGLFRLGDSSL